MTDWLQPIWSNFSDRIASGSLPHAILLGGPQGTGKSLLADLLVRSTLCLSPDQNGKACGDCRSCALVEAGTHPDWYHLAPEPDSRVIKVDQVRGLIGQVSLTSSIASLQTFVINPADSMNLNAANALLKTLEEPSPGTLIILVASQPHLLPLTVRSRCQFYSVPVPERDAALAWLRENEPELDALSAEQALDAAGGGPLLARDLITDGLIQHYLETLQALNALSSGSQDVLELASRWAKDEHHRMRLDWWCGWIAQQLWQLSGRVTVHPSSLTVTADFASLINYLDRLLQGRRLLATTVSRELLFEELLIGWRDLMNNGG